MTRFAMSATRSSVQRVLVLAACLGIAASFGCQTKESAEPKAEKGEKIAKPAAHAVEPGATTGQDVLDRMVNAYRKAATYADAGQLHLTAEADGEKIIDQTYDFSFTLERPNKVRAMAYLGMLVCDGKEMKAAIQNLKNQVLVRPAPARVTLKNLFADRILAEAMNRGIAGTLPQAMFLLADDPLKALMSNAEGSELAEPGEIEGQKCDRVKIRRAEGSVTLWIDQKTSVLRRVVLPTDMLRQDIGRSKPVDRVSLIAEFTGAQLGGKIDPKAFVFEVPADAEVVRVFIPPHTAQLLGKRVPDFKFVTPDGKPFTRDSLDGKVTLLDFWATWCGPCRQSLPELGSMYEKLKVNPKVAFYAVSVDRPEVKDEQIAKLLADLKVSIPFLRDADRTTNVFRMDGSIPTTLVIGADGILQDFLVGANPERVAEWPGKIEKLLAGQSIYEKPLREYEDEMKRYAAMVEKDYQSDAASAGPVLGEQAAAETKVTLPETKIAEPSQPKTIKLTSLWKCTEVKSPGNLLVLTDKGGASRLIAIEEWKNIVEVGLDGKRIARHSLNVEESEVIGNIRTAAGADGKRYVAAFMATQQRCHLFDENWKQVLSYPKDALTKPHSGIADVELGDLVGDGSLKMYISYLGVVGVQGVSLDGKRLWSNRSVANVGGIAIGGADPQGHRSLICTGAVGALAVLDYQGERKAEITIPNEMLHWIFAADLLHNNQPLWCGLASSKPGENIAVGFDLTGAEQWRYRLPDGVPPPMELIVAGQIAKDGPGQWILPGADGSIHILAADGKLVDKFNSGVTLQGVATVAINGQPAIVISSPAGIEAWKIEK